jgi:hypothetical protein
MKKNDNSSLTQDLLFSKFGSVIIPVEEIAETYLNLARRTALNKAKTHSLPFPCFKLGDSNKAPYVVHLTELVNFIEKKRSEERNVWKSFQIG